jgi:hypothetical protein
VQHLRTMQGVDQVYTKGMQLAKLMRAVRRELKVRRARTREAASDTAASDQTADDSEKASDAAASDPAALTVMAVDKSVFDPADILRAVGGSVVIMRRLLMRFDGEKHLNAIEAALESSDARKLHHEIHTVRGLLLYLYAHKAHEQVSKFEAAASASIGKELTSAQREHFRAVVGQLRIDMARVDANQRAVLASYA